MESCIARNQKYKWKKTQTMKTASRNEKQLKESMWQSTITGSNQCLSDHIIQRKMLRAGLLAKQLTFQDQINLLLARVLVFFWSKSTDKERTNAVHQQQASDRLCMCWAMAVHALVAQICSACAVQLDGTCLVVLMNFSYVGLALRRRQSYPVCGQWPFV